MIKIAGQTAFFKKGDFCAYCYIIKLCGNFEVVFFGYQETTNCQMIS